MNILIIDDDALILRTLALHLEAEGHTVTTAKDGSEAHDRIENSRTRQDLIICDLMMPNISGLTFITMLRNFHNYSIPVIVISSLDRADLLAAQAGIKEIDFVPKPFEVSAVIEKVNKYNVKTCTP